MAVATLADAIERYIKELFQKTALDFVEIRRAELAMRFSCVPSQISYVLETRFTPERGYAVQTRRGGGGYVRIVRLSTKADRAELARWLMEQVGPAVSARQAEEVVDRLQGAGLLSEREAMVWLATLRRQTQWVPEGIREQVRAALLRGAIMATLLQRMAEDAPST